MTKFGPAAPAGKTRLWRAIGLGKAGENLYIEGQGVPALVCRRAFARFKENMAVRTLFFLGILRDFSERSRSQSRAFFRASVSGSCRRPVLSETAGAGSRLNANRLHRWGRPFCGLESPATGSNLRARVRLEPPRRAGFQQRRPARVVQRQGRTASRNRRFPDMKT